MKVGLDDDIPFKEIVRALERTFSGWQQDERARKAKQHELSQTGPGGKQRTHK